MTKLSWNCKVCRYLVEQAPLKDPLDRLLDDGEDVEVLPVDGVYHGYSQAPTVGLDGQQQGLQPSWANLGQSEITPFLEELLHLTVSVQEDEDLAQGQPCPDVLAPDQPLPAQPPVHLHQHLPCLLVFLWRCTLSSSLTASSSSSWSCSRSE